ncbi:MAG: bifunctional riboflavin kinase/FAD synthetase [Bernardetiaceae bacterium]
MNVYLGLGQVPALPSTIVTSGSFDGVHQGHQTILERLVSIQQGAPDCQTLVITFDPHPRQVLQPDKPLVLLSTLPEKIERLRLAGINHLLVLPFTKAFARTRSEEFIEDILIRCLRTQHLVIGYDHRFGHNREGSFAYLQAHAERYPFLIEEIPRQTIDAVGVSSTRIREALRQGDPETAQRYLGYPYTLTGRVVKGQQIGRQIGFPTANLAVDDPHKLVPADGIYAVELTHQQNRYQGMLSIGLRPTIGNDLKRTIEVNIFDFQEDIYGQSLTLHFIAYLRREEKYADLSALKAQLYRDRLAALTALSTKK